MKAYALFFMLVLQASFAQKEVKHVVYFETDEYSIVETERYRLLLFLQEIEGIDIEKISIYGFCDDRGSDSYNLKLSQQRADAIKEVFSNNEITESLITNVDGKGEVLLKIVKEDDVQKIRGLNRKVEIIVAPYDPPRPKVVRKNTTDKLLSKRLKVGDKIVLENLLFQTGYSYLIEDSKGKLDNIVEALQKRPDVYFSIEGHVCCTNGDRDAIDRKTNIRNLSFARAKYIYDYFVSKGIDKDRMRYVGLRRRYPLGGLPENDRRVEIRVTKILDK
ncbi:OmpA family protein [Winogradskyella sp. A3E31]|uniref:OmpA family protein n=1 Tax=Winogradskyella sp. A3E31 TaxID=3349637 RepID=UPI00398B82D6